MTIREALKRWLGQPEGRQATLTFNRVIPAIRGGYEPQGIATVRLIPGRDLEIAIPDGCTFASLRWEQPDHSATRPAEPGSNWHEGGRDDNDHV